MEARASHYFISLYFFVIFWQSLLIWNGRLLLCVCISTWMCYVCILLQWRFTYVGFPFWCKNFLVILRKEQSDKMKAGKLFFFFWAHPIASNTEIFCYVGYFGRMIRSAVCIWRVKASYRVLYLELLSSIPLLWNALSYWKRKQVLKGITAQRGFPTYLLVSCDKGSCFT